MTGINRLAAEISPYLQQHAGNPVAWFPWNDEAFETARSQDKPIFLSIGYSTCHWCHVMAHECFEDEEVARLMNEAFIPVKVDREELPHIDAVYMNVCQLLTGSGGWPLTIIMTPDKKPFFAATYLPKHSRQGLIGLMELIPLIGRAWQTTRADLLRSAEEISRAVAHARSETCGDDPGEHALHQAFQWLSGTFSSAYGGFGDAPKFPVPHNIMFLLRYAERTGEGQALFMAERTLDAMRMGGIYDHIGFGFHRYATDRKWLVPHFEKMLYDQALLAIAYTEAFLATARTGYKKTAEEIIEYVLRDLAGEGGLFFSAEDADSEGREGKFYLWTDSELRSLLGKEDYAIARKAYCCAEAGNFPEGRAQQENILHLEDTAGGIAKNLGMEEETLVRRLEQIRAILLAHRSRRVRPFRDNKALTDWNGLMIAALAKAYQAFGNENHVRAAQRAATFILERMVSTEGRLSHVFRAGEVRTDALADDYAFFIWGLIELYEATFDPAYLDAALGLARTCIEHYWDHEQGGFFLTADDAGVVLSRTKDAHDGALPSANSVLVYDLARLARMTGDDELGHTAHQTARAFSGSINSSPAAYTFMLAGLDFLLGPAQEIVIAGSPESPDTHEMLRALQRRFLPRTVVMMPPRDKTRSVLDHARDKVPLGNRATAYVCSEKTCRPPTTVPAEMIALVTGRPGD